MRFRRPSPAMVISIVALVMATTGTAVAAVSFARNAGAVDGKSAVWASSSKASAAGKLVTTRASGPDTGKFANRFVAHVPYTNTFVRALDVVDNAPGAGQTLSTTRLGRLAASCNDQRAGAGVEDPTMTVSFVNTRTVGVNVARHIGTGNPQVVGLPAGAQHTFTINGSNVFRLHVESAGVNVVYEAQVRQDDAGTAAARCFIAATAETFAP